MVENLFLCFSACEEIAFLQFSHFISSMPISPSYELYTSQEAFLCQDCLKPRQSPKNHPPGTVSYTLHILYTI